MFTLLASLALGAFAASNACVQNMGSKKAELYAIADHWHKMFEYINANSNKEIEADYVKLLQNPECQDEIYRELLIFKRNNPATCINLDEKNYIPYKWENVGKEKPNFKNEFVCDAVLTLLLQTQGLMKYSEAEFKSHLPDYMR